jgi:hypothetical protein
MYPITGCGLCTFPNVFETVYTIEFKLHDVRGYYDHAHSNYIHTLCTMGLAGIISYLLLLFHTAYILIKTLTSKVLKAQKKIIYLCFLTMLTGYMVYGIADFDETSILFYFIMYLAILKIFFSEDVVSKSFSLQENLTGNRRPVIILVSILLIAFCSANFYKIYNHERAVYYFSKAYRSHGHYDFQNAFKFFPLATELWASNSYFHFEYGGAMLDYATTDINIKPDAKKLFLNKAREEFHTAMDGFYSRNENLKFISIADYETGDTVEAESIKNQLLCRDSLMINYRLSLAEYYITKKYYADAQGELLFCSTYLPGSPWIYRLTMSILKDKNCPEPELFSRKLLAIDPGNESAKLFLKNR